MKKSQPRHQVTTVENPTYVVDSSVLKRYDPCNILFFSSSRLENRHKNILENKPGYTGVDYAMAEAAWTVLDVWKEATSWGRINPEMENSLRTRWREGKYAVEDVAKMTRQLKRVARLYGADLVGIAEIDQNWIYTNQLKLAVYNDKPLEMPEGVKFAVVMAIEMDEIPIATSPACPAAAAVGLGYSKMAFLVPLVAEFIRNLGYKAIPCGNDTGLSIPLAIDAGLGQLGRNGLLITPKYGPRIRLCKVFTDLPLQPDKPIDFGVTNFCRRCKKCAEACEAEAISKDTEPSWQTVCRNNNPGAQKWYVNGVKCYDYWIEHGIDCCTCISVCPFNPGYKEAKPEDFWEK